MKLKFLLIGTSLSLIPNLLYAQCAVTDCQQLGYTSLKSCDNGLKCPFGEYWACPKVEEKAVLGACTGYAKNCKIADILNSDGTCTNDDESGKTPIGVGVDIGGGNDKCGYAMTARPIETNIKWSTVYVNTGAFQSDSSRDAIKDFDVSGNMTKIIQSGNSGTYPAAYAALNYAPFSALTSKGKWMLPTAGILNSLYTNLNAINNTIFKLDGTELMGDDEHIWSSSEHANYSAWFFCTNISTGAGQGGIDWGSKGEFSDYLAPPVVRPVIAF